MTQTPKQPQNQSQNEEGMGGVYNEQTVEEMQSEIIRICLAQWLTFKPSNRNKRIIIELGVKIFDMLVKYRASQGELQYLKTQLNALKMMGVPLLEA